MALAQCATALLPLPKLPPPLLLVRTRHDVLRTGILCHEYAWQPLEAVQQLLPVPGLARHH